MFFIPANFFKVWKSAFATSISFTLDQSFPDGHSSCYSVKLKSCGRESLDWINELARAPRSVARFLSKSASSFFTTWIVLLPSAYTDNLLQRISKDVHRALACDPVPWGDLPWEIKTAARNNLEAKCREHNLFVGRDISGAVNWRLYHLQKPRKDSIRMREYAALSSRGQQGSQEPSHKPRPYDPVKDFWWFIV